MNKLTKFADDQVARLMGNFMDLEQVLSKNVDASNIRNLAITTALINTGAVTPAKTSGGVARIYSEQYTGDGTAGRAIAIGFMPRIVKIVRQTNGDVFEALGDGTTAWTYFQRDNAGTVTAAAAEFQGIVGTTVKLGSDPDGGDSNQDTEVYWLEALA